jgi:hypothetical protein
MAFLAYNLNIEFSVLSVSFVVSLVAWMKRSEQNRRERF